MKAWRMLREKFGGAGTRDVLTAAIMARIAAISWVDSGNKMTGCCLPEYPPNYKILDTDTSRCYQYDLF